jgi:hypothetical protein
VWRRLRYRFIAHADVATNVEEGIQAVVVSDQCITSVLAEDIAGVVLIKPQQKDTWSLALPTAREHLKRYLPVSTIVPSELLRRNVEGHSLGTAAGTIRDQYGHQRAPLRPAYWRLFVHSISADSA